MPVRRVDDVLVHLIGDEKGIVLARQFADEDQLFLREHLATRIGRIADDDGARLLREGAAQLVAVEAEAGRVQRHVDRPRAGEDRVRAVVLVEGRENNHRVARVAHGHDGHEHCLRPAAGGDHVSVRVDLQTHEPGLFLGQGLPEGGRAPGDGVLVVISVRHLAGGGLEQCGRRVEVGEALR